MKKMMASKDKRLCKGRCENLKKNPQVVDCVDQKDGPVARDWGRNIISSENKELDNMLQRVFDSAVSEWIGSISHKYLKHRIGVDHSKEYKWTCIKLLWYRKAITLI